MSTPYITSIERRGIEKGLRQGLSEERALLRRLAKRQFDATVAEALSRLLENVEDPDQLADIGEWLLDEPSGEAFLTRVRQLIVDEPD